MLFNSFQFAVFFAGVLLGTMLLPARLRARFLLLASFLFYALWVPSALLVLGALLVVNHALLRSIAASLRPKVPLGASIAVSLGTLALFKYGPSAVTMLRPSFPRLSPLAANLTWWLMPLGISFYTFEMISIAVDVHHRRFPCPRFERYALVVTFFPHLVAGPILRGPELLPQLETGGERTLERTRRALWLFLAGLVKKVVLSDYLLQPFVNEAFQSGGFASGPVHLLGVYAFAFQIYSDFSGYSDMARGIACALGFELPMNFAEPYLARDPAEFWRRWHMTLSRWLRDYLYVPLGGNRRGPARTRVNLMLTMALGGLWHGAGLGFLVWGILHGVLLVVYRGPRRTGADDAPLRLRDAPRIVLLFHLVCLLWIPFRAADAHAALVYFRGLFTTSYLGPWPLFPLCVVASCAALHVAERWIRLRLPAVQRWAAGSAFGPVLEGAAAGTIVTLAFYASGAGVQFIYFQF